MSAGERDELIAQYEAGPEIVRAAYERVPAAARQWRPAPGEWSAHDSKVPQRAPGLCGLDLRVG